MGKKNQKLNLDKDLLEKWYIEDKLTYKQISQKFKDVGVDVGASSVGHYLDVYGIPKRTPSENTSLQIKRAKELDIDSYLLSRKRAGESISKTMQQKGFDELSRLSKKSRKTYYENRTAEQEERDRQIQIKRGKLGRESQRQNGTFGNKTSKEEDNYYSYLLTLFGDEVIRQYRDKRYSRPHDGYEYNCDFYIPSKDLFIEYNGFYTHGPEPFDKNNVTHIELKKFYKKKDVDMSVWTNSDVRKLKVAIRNNINLLRVYPKNKLFYTSNGKTITLTDITSL